MTKRFWNSLTRATFKKFKLDDAITPTAFIGKSVFAHKGAPDGERESVKIESILGSKRWTKCMEINGTHLVNMLSFFTQLMEGREPSAEENADFDLATEITDIREIKDGPSKGKQEQAEGTKPPTGFRNEYDGIDPGAA